MKFNTMGKPVKKLAGLFVLFFFPYRCPVCDSVLPISWTGENRCRPCPQCQGKLKKIREPRCMKCGKQLLDEVQEYCYDCSRHRRSFHHNIGIWNYDDAAKGSITAFKYHQRQEYAAFYIEELWAEYEKEISRWGADGIIPVPVHVSRRRKRGYNQAELLGYHLAKKMDIPLYQDVLYRRKKTAAQKSLNPEERIRNMKDALWVRQVPDLPERVILIDDIYTTGSTLEACSRVLLEAGVREIFGITVCVGEPDR